MASFSPLKFNVTASVFLGLWTSIWTSSLSSYSRINAAFNLAISFCSPWTKICKKDNFPFYIRYFPNQTCLASKLSKTAILYLIFVKTCISWCHNICRIIELMFHTVLCLCLNSVHYSKAQYLDTICRKIQTSRIRYIDFI